MTAEEQRDRLLKRLLPGLAAGVVYAAFVGPMLGGKTETARKEYDGLMQKGISAAALPGMRSQLNGVRAEIAKLKQQDTKINAELAGYAGFLASGGSANSASEQLAALFAAHRLRVIEEKLQDNASPEAFTKSLRDTQQWLKQALQLNDKMTVTEIHFIGTYADTYAALAVLANGSIKALPVALSMQQWKSAERSEAGMLEWRLKLWI